VQIAKRDVLLDTLCGVEPTGAVPTTPQLPVATGCRIRSNVVLNWRFCQWEVREQLRCPGDRKIKTSKFHPILIFKWTLGMHVSGLPV
jgi:hypothetical protein